MKNDIGLIGLAVMGQNLVLNILDKGFRVSVFNRTFDTMNEFLKREATNYPNLSGFKDLSHFVESLDRPRRIILMVKAGEAIDGVISQLIPFLEKEDVLIDGGNSDYRDTQRRVESLSQKGIYYIGSGVSGGEEGARKGPSLMPGGNEKGWDFIKPIFLSIAAKTEKGDPCCQWIGKGGSGHYVKMIHNGIEYGDMQLIAEVYHILRVGFQLSCYEIADIFKEWNQTELESYLIEITSHILRFKENDSFLVDKILDKAGQKGTGKLTSEDALEKGIPLTLISEAVFFRFLSSLKKERIKAESVFHLERGIFEGNISFWKEKIRKSLLASKVISYAQGFMMLREASSQYQWDLNLSAIASTWKAGCIIRSQFLGDIERAFQKNPLLENLVLDSYFSDLLKNCLFDWREVVSQSAKLGISIPALMSGLSFFEGYCSKDLPANLIQAQRDYFGSHKFERLDKPEGEFFHNKWY